MYKIIKGIKGLFQYCVLGFFYALASGTSDTQTRTKERVCLIEPCESNNNERSQGNLTSSFHFILSLFETIFLQLAGLLAKF